MINLEDMSPEQIVYLASTLAIAMSKNLSIDEMSLLSDFFSVLGDNLGMIASRKALSNDTEVITE